MAGDGAVLTPVLSTVPAREWAWSGKGRLPEAKPGVPAGYS